MTTNLRNVVISIDVGIKNLSYCIISSLRQKEFDILDWDNISLYERKKEVVCDGILCIKGKQHNKSVRSCDKVARYYNKSTGYNRCRLHTKNVDNCVFYDKVHTHSVYSKLNITALREYYINLCNSCGVEHVQHSTKKDIIVSIKTLLDNHLFIPFKKDPRATDVDMVTVSESIQTQFDCIIEQMYEQISTESNITILIENQIGPLAMRMKTVQGMLTQYFTMKGFKNIKFISSSNKLKVMIGESIISTDTANYNSYKERKIAGVTKVTEFIKQYIPDKMNWFDCHKKKDDLADACLQSLWYICIHTNCSEPNECNV